LGFEKSQRSVTHDSLRYINILTYLLTYLQYANYLITSTADVMFYPEFVCLSVC